VTACILSVSKCGPLPKFLSSDFMHTFQRVISENMAGNRLSWRRRRKDNIKMGLREIFVRIKGGWKYR
jgi:hypothetical protein